MNEFKTGDRVTVIGSTSEYKIKSFVGKGAAYVTDKKGKTFQVALTFLNLLPKKKDVKE